MRFEYTEELKEYMLSKNKKNIIVEIATSDSSDFEVTELHVHFVSDKDVDFFCSKKHFRIVETEAGRVLLPPYRLEFSDVITFSLKKFLFIPYIKYTGIKL